MKAALANEFLVKTAELNKLNNEELYALLDKGNKEIRDELIKKNLNLVWKVVYKFSGLGEDPADLFQIGCIGLMKAIDAYDLSKMVKLSTFAFQGITNTICNHLRDNRLIKVDRGLQNKAIQVNKYINQFMKENHGNKPSNEQILKQFEFDMFTLSRVFTFNKSTISLQQPINNDQNESDTIQDILSVKDDYSYESAELKILVESLDRMERDIIIKRFFEDKTQKEVAEELNTSQAQVSRLETKALQTLKQAI